MTMTIIQKALAFSMVLLLLTGCVSKKRYDEMQSLLELEKLTAAKCNEDIGRLAREINTCEQDKARLEAALNARQDQIAQLQAQVTDIQRQRDRTVDQVGDLTALSQSATKNIGETLAQLEGKDKYIRVLQAAKSQTDSINLALAVNLKSVLAQGIADDDIEVKVDKTVVFVNLSDKMLYESGSYNISNRANDVLAKIAQIVQSRPDLEIMIEGYTDNVPINTACVKDNWDLSVLRATSVARALQTRHGVDPNRLIPAGRGQYNALADNATAEGRATNRRTRIIILPKIDQFYDLLNPANAPK